MSRTPVSPIVRRAVAAALVLAFAATSSAPAQDAAPRPSPWELRVSGGAYLAAGDLRQDLRDGKVMALQVSRAGGRHLAFGGTLSWARSRELAATGTPRVDLLSADLGAEVRSGQRRVAGPVSLGVFAGAGGGMRKYHFRRPTAEGSSHLAGYGSVGVDLGVGRAGLRVEARGYLAGYRAPVALAGSTTRGDLVILGALRFNRRADARN